MHVFVYGPLLNPASLRAALPEVDLGACRPARLAGHVRCFDLESPNDGSHPDASYTHPGGAPPSHLLLCNLRPSRDYAVNGVCIPVREAGLAGLERREHRYDLREVTDLVSEYPQNLALTGPVVTFIGKPEFTATRAGGPPSPGAIAARSYLHTLTSGAKYWDAAAPEFYHLTMASTLFPPPAPIADLIRTDR